MTSFASAIRHRLSQLNTSIRSQSADQKSVALLSSAAEVIEAAIFQLVEVCKQVVQIELKAHSAVKAKSSTSSPSHSSSSEESVFEALAITHSRARQLAFSLAKVYVASLLFEQAVSSTCLSSSSSSLSSTSSSAASFDASDLAALGRWVFGAGGLGNLFSSSASTSASSLSSSLSAVHNLVSPILIESPSQAAARQAANCILALDIDPRTGSSRGCGNAEPSTGKLRARY